MKKIKPNDKQEFVVKTEFVATPDYNERIGRVCRILTSKFIECKTNTKG